MQAIILADPLAFSHSLSPLTALGLVFTNRNRNLLVPR